MAYEGQAVRFFGVEARPDLRLFTPEHLNQRKIRGCKRRKSPLRQVSAMNIANHDLIIACEIIHFSEMTSVNHEGFDFVRSSGGISEYKAKSNGLTVLLLEDHSAPVATVSDATLFFLFIHE